MLYMKNKKMERKKRGKFKLLAMMAQWTVWLRNGKKERVGIWGNNKEGTHYTFTRSHRWLVVHRTQEINSRTLHYEFVRHWANKTGQTCMARWEVVLVVFLFFALKCYFFIYTERAETGVWCVLDGRLLLMIRKLQHASTERKRGEREHEEKKQRFFHHFMNFTRPPRSSRCVLFYVSLGWLVHSMHHLTDSFREIVKKERSADAFIAMASVTCADGWEEKQEANSILLQTIYTFFSVDDSLIFLISLHLLSAVSSRCAMSTVDFFLALLFFFVCKFELSHFAYS